MKTFNIFLCDILIQSHMHVHIPGLSPVISAVIIPRLKAKLQLSQRFAVHVHALPRTQLHGTTWNLCRDVLRICTFPELFVGAQLPSCSCPPPGSPLLPFSKICQALFDADPFPAKVRFLLFHQSRLQNLAPPAFSCFLSKRKCCFASVFFFLFFSPFLPPPSPASSPGQIWNTDCKNVACVGQVLISKNEKSSLKKKKSDTLPPRPPFTQAPTQTQAATSTLILHLIF